ncbi:unnamed protein product, partial [Ascophyllum nodosum]
RHIVQDWDVWLSKPDQKGNDENIYLENIYSDELRGENLLLYGQLQRKFKDPLVGPDNFYLQYKLASEEYPIRIELSQEEQALAAFTKFAALKKKDYVKFGPILVLCCRGPEWTTSPKNIEVTEQALRGRPALTRYLMDKYMGGELSLDVLDEMMTLGVGDLRRAVYGAMPDVTREHHGYLLGKASRKDLSPEELYKAGMISLQAYEEIIFPEIKREGEKREAHHPEPEEPHRCIVCRQTVAVISCMECMNRVCQACIRRECLESGDSFLYFHHQHCLRFGRPHRKPLPLADDIRRRGLALRPLSRPASPLLAGLNNPDAGENKR